MHIASDLSSVWNQAVYLSNIIFFGNPKTRKIFIELEKNKALHFSTDRKCWEMHINHHKR